MSFQVYDSHLPLTYTDFPGKEGIHGGLFPVPLLVKMLSETVIHGITDETDEKEGTRR